MPDEELHNRLHKIEHAIDEHRRGEAEAELKILEAQHPEHLVTWTGRRLLEGYDGDVSGLLASVEKILSRFPKDPRSQHAKVAYLRDLGRRDERLAALKEMAESKKADPAFWLQYAQELADDAREHLRARMLLAKAIRWNYGYPANYTALARLEWSAGRFDRALELDRFALCLEDKDENLARTYFQSARVLGKTDEALAVLRKRFERFGAKSMLSARTLYFALIDLERVDEAMAVLLRGLELRPTDGELMAFIGESYLVRGKLAEAREYLERARGVCQVAMWARFMAGLARQEHDLPRARDLWLQVLETEPLAIDVHRNLAQTIADMEGRDAAVAHLREWCDRFPHHFTLAQMLLDWMREDPASVREPVVRRLIGIHPANAWARREYVILLCDVQRHDEARPELALAVQLEPNTPGTCMTSAYFYRGIGDNARARKACRNAIAISVDVDIAQQDLLSLCDTLAERREALEFIEGQLIKQVTLGQGLLTFREIAIGTLEADELLASLERGLQARPDLWHAFAAVLRQLTFMARYDTALELGKRAVERFPHQSALWNDLAALHRARRDDAAEIEALERTLVVAPNWTTPRLALAAVHERAGRLDEARRLFDAAIARAPLAGAGHIALAEFVARHDSKEQAREIARHAVRLDPSNEGAWGKFLEWSVQLKSVDDAIALARQMITERPGEARAWLRLAQSLVSRPIDPDPKKDADNINETIAAYDEVLKRNPYLVDVHDRKISLLADVNRYDDAIAASRPAVFGDAPPIPLLGRAACIVARRDGLAAAVDAMRQVLTRDRNYRFGWANLADWTQSLGRWDEYLEAAENMLRMDPADVAGLAYRGEAKLKLGRRDEALVDLRRACERAPGYLLPALLLFEEHFSAGELDDAQAVLDRIREHVQNDEINSREVRLAVRRQDTGRAMQILRTLGRAEGEASGPLDSAVGVLEGAGLRDDVVRTLAEMAQDGRSHPCVAILLFERTPVGHEDFDERLKLCKRSVDRMGSKLRGLDLMAERLAGAGRHAEALKICRGPASPDAVMPLAGRAAWIEKQQGHHKAAIKSMRAIVKDNPAYWWGWSQLAMWAEEQGKPDLHLEAAEKLILIAPNDATGYIERAIVRVNSGDLAGGREDRLRALTLNPRNVALGHIVIDTSIAERDLAAARKAYEIIKPFGAPAELDECWRKIRRAENPLAAIFSSPAGAVIACVGVALLLIVAMILVSAMSAIK